MPEVTLNLPGRDEKIDEYKQYLRDLGKAGIYYTTYAHMGNGIWSSDPETTRGGAPARAFKLETAKGYWDGKVFEPPLTHGRKFSQEELWENYTYFIKQVVPVAEEVGVRIGIHPDDPPVPELGGVPRHMFGTFDGYIKALSRSPIVPTSASASAAAPGWKAASTPARTSSTRSASLRSSTSCGRSTSATSARRFPISSKLTSMAAIPT